MNEGIRAHRRASTPQCKSLLINDLRFLVVFVVCVFRPNCAPLVGRFCCNHLKVNALGDVVCGMGGTTFGYFYPPKALIVNTVSASFLSIYAPMTPHIRATHYD